MSLVCPVCKMPLSVFEKSFRCENGHCYDIAKKGYVNLLMSQQSGARRHGDDNDMLCARRDFFDAGYYDPLLNGIVGTAREFYGGGELLDCGCGDCRFTEKVSAALGNPVTYGVDISKTALGFGGRNSVIKVVSSTSRLPFESNSFGLMLNLFSPCFGSEFSRVLQKNGFLIRAVPLERHLFSLKSAVYDTPYENATDSTDIEGFSLEYAKELKEMIHIKNNADIIKLFTMTPYYHKTSRADFDKLALLETLDTELEVGIYAYKKR